MKLKNILAWVAIPLSMASCKKTLEPRELDFDVVSQNNAKQTTTTFKVTDTINFVFSGNPDHITFYSGEIGRKYDYKDRVSDTSKNVVFSFSTALNTVGSGSLQLLAATDFPITTGVNAKDSLAAISTYPGNWTDISNRAALATNATTKASGNINLADYAKAGKPIYLAFRYRAEAGLAQSKWTITNVSLAHKTVDTTYVINSQALVVPATFPAFATSAGWLPINVYNRNIKFAVAPTSFTITGNTATPATNSVATESWMLTGPIDLSKVIPDAGVPIKDMTSNASNTLYGGPIPSSFASYTYKFKNKGIYNVTFLAVTSTRDGQVSKTKTITLTIN